MANIVFIDDDYSTELIVEHLSQRGHEVHRVACVDEALHDADRIASCDLVVLDLIMPQSRELVRDTPDRGAIYGNDSLPGASSAPLRPPNSCIYGEPRPCPEGSGRS